MGKKGKRRTRKSTRSDVAVAAASQEQSKERTKSSSRKSSFSVAESESESFCIPDPPEPTTTNYIDRPPPSLDGMVSYLSNLDERLNDILTSKRKKASLPTNDQLARLKSKTARRVATALSRFEIARELIGNQFDVTTKLGKLQLFNLSMDDLVNDEAVLEASVHMIAGLADTDLRLCPCVGQAMLEKWPTPMLQCFVPVEYYPLNQGEMQMHQLSNEEFVVLLATTVVVGSTNIFGSYQQSLRLVHELYLQAKNIEWSKFSSNKLLKGLTEETCHNALANAGIRIYRLLYRKKKADRCEGPTDVKFSSKALLKKIEEFARDLMKNSESGESEFVMGWIAEQNGYVFDIHPLSVEADALHWYTKAYTKADKYGNDFISSEARIQAANSIQSCGEGAIVAIPNKVFLRRDFRTQFGGKGKQEEKELSVHSLFYSDQHHLQMAVDREWERLESGIPLIELTTEEDLVICWKKSLTLWNEAMEYYDSMADIGMGYFIYAETAAWENVLPQIKHLIDELKISLEYNFILPVVRIGNTKRDVGVQMCENCNNCDGNKKCSRCRKVVYSSCDCQKAHWAKHKLTCCKK
ncbi:predicted protein [Chaetoceros tenuissimus]|uniref:MYND-type domain-containing protein n=1 Tax=Chaetoceros tenuissimus TaxID=426638 RepID=A0AAD3H1Z4_9STRA|nr:predicted protein [Chaetoceros tenuissimus]